MTQKRKIKKKEGAEVCKELKKEEKNSISHNFLLGRNDEVVWAMKRGKKVLQ